MVASAALAAVNNLLPLDYSLALEDVGITEVGQEEVVVAVSALLNMRGEERRLVGCSLVGNDLHRSVVFASLDSVNRSLPFVFRRNLARSEEIGGIS